MAHYIKDGAYYGPAPEYSVMVPDESDLEDIPSELPVGTIAYTAGYKKMWQKAADGEWVSLL